MPTENELSQMVREHYDNSLLMNLEGEIYFDDQLSRAEVDVALDAYQNFTGRLIPDRVYLPCAGTLRHVPPLLARGVTDITAVDLSKRSLLTGLQHYPGIRDQIAIYGSDIRNILPLMSVHDRQLALLLGNSFGDVTDLPGHIDFIRALAEPLERSGVLIFDYVGNRYSPKEGVIETAWPDRINLPEGSLDVIDRRTREYQPLDSGLGILQFTCEVTTPEGEVIIPQHNYSKLVVPNDILLEQFKEIAGMDLNPLGPIRVLSPYHDQRIAEKNDLGMMGEPDHLYLAIKR